MYKRDPGSQRDRGDIPTAERTTMARHIEVGIVSGSGARFESPLALWIAIWQRQLAFAGTRRARVLPDPSFAKTINADEPSRP
jgi:hypothetical protein